MHTATVTTGDTHAAAGRLPPQDIDATGESTVEEALTAMLSLTTELRLSASEAITVVQRYLQLKGLCVAHDGVSRTWEAVHSFEIAGLI